MKKIIKPAIGILTAAAGTQALMFWLTADGGKSLLLAAGWIASYIVSMYCFSGLKEDECKG